MHPFTTTPLLTLEDVGRQLQTRPEWVRRKILARELGAHRIGGLLRVSQEDLDDYLRRAREDPLRPRKKMSSSKIALSEVLDNEAVRHL
jgi:excisionase family DNA binding protein